jgi:hypothetical protein
MMNVYLNLVAATGSSLVMIIMSVLVTHVIHPPVVYLKISLSNVKLKTSVTKTIVILKSDVLMTW